MKTEALILALSHAALGDAAPPAGAHRQHLGHGRAGLPPLRRGLRRRQRGGVIGFTRVLRSYQHMRGCFVQLCSLAARSCTPGTGFQAAPRARPSGGDARQHRYSHRSFC